MSTEFKSILTEEEVHHIFKSYNNDIENVEEYVNEADAFVVNIIGGMICDPNRMAHLTIVNAVLHMMDILSIKGENPFNATSYIFTDEKYLMFKAETENIYKNSSKRSNFTTVDGKKLYIRELELLRYIKDSKITVEMLSTELLKKIIACAKAIIEKFGEDAELGQTVEGCYCMLNMQMYEELSKVKMPYSTVECIIDHVILYTGAFTLGWCIGSILGHVLLALSSNTGGAALYASTPGLTVMPA